MKKYVFICLLALVATVFTSCNRNEPLVKKTIDLTVKSSNWAFDEGINAYYCHFDVKELTEYVYNYGEYSIHREYNTGKSNAYQVALPETTYIQIELDNGDETTTPYYYQQHIDYALGIGFVEIFCTISDFYYEGFSPEGMNFRLQLTY